MTRALGCHFSFELEFTEMGVSPGLNQATEPIALLLHEGLCGEHFGSLRRIRLNIAFRHQGPPPSGFRASDVSAYARYLDTLPKYSVQRKTASLEIKQTTSLSLKEFGDDCIPTVEGFEKLATEVLISLDSAQSRVSRLDEDDLVALLKRVRTLLKSMPREVVAFNRELARLKALDRARATASHETDPWAFLDVDWSKYHPAARELLDDPFFWDESDDYSPFGNDTGADIVDHYRSWRRKEGRPSSDALSQVEEVLEKWGMSEARDDARLVRDEAFIALAFAQVAFEGSAAPDVLSCAIGAIDRQLGLCARWQEPETRRTTLERMRKKLLSLGAERT